MSSFIWRFFFGRKPPAPTTAGGQYAKVRDDKGTPLIAKQSYQLQILHLEPCRDWDERLKCDIVTVTDFRVKATQGQHAAEEPTVDSPRSTVYGADYEVLICSRHMLGQGNMKKIKVAYRNALTTESEIIEIDPNLDDALRHLRHESLVYYFWVEELCINQQDNIREASKALHLARVYQNAKNICVWIRKDTDRSSLAFDFIDRLNVKPFDSLFTDIATHSQWFAFLELMGSPWSGDLPFLQDGGLIRHATIRCGSQEISWSAFADAVEVFRSKSEEIRVWFEKQSSDSSVTGDSLIDMASTSTLYRAVLMCLTTRTYFIGSSLINLLPSEESSRKSAKILREEKSQRPTLDGAILTTHLLGRDTDDSSSSDDSDNEVEEILAAAEGSSLGRFHEVLDDQNNRVYMEFQNALATESDVDEDLVHPRRHYTRLKGLRLEVIKHSAVLQGIKSHLRDTALPKSREKDYIQECTFLLQAIDHNLRFLKDKKFCDSTINFLRADPMRPNVAILTTLDTESVLELSQCLKDSDLKALEGLNKKCKQIFQNWYPFSASALTIADCYAFGVLQLLDLIICCYAGGHVAPLKAGQTGSALRGDVSKDWLLDETIMIQHQHQLHQRSGTKQVTLRKRRLKCLDSFLGCQTVWVFHDEGYVFPEYYRSMPRLLANIASPDTMYLAARSEHFRDIWGPMWQIVDPKHRILTTLRYDLENGSIIPGMPPPPPPARKPSQSPIYFYDKPTFQRNERVKPRPIMPWHPRPSGADTSALLGHDEQFCHWISDAELRKLKVSGQRMESMSNDKPVLLIGGRHSQSLELQANSGCYCNAAEVTKALGDSSRRRAGGTSNPRRVVDSEAVNVSFGSGGFGFSIAGNVSSKIIAGRLAKEILHKRWVHDKAHRNPDALRRLDGIRISFCTDHSERISLVRLFATATIAKLEDAFRPVKNQKGRASLLNALQTDPDSLIDLYHNPISHESVSEFVSECIDSLNGTGMSHTSRETIIAFWMHQGVDYLIEVKRMWSKMIEDDFEASAFVVLEEQCLVCQHARGCQNSSRTGKAVIRDNSQLPSFFVTNLTINLNVVEERKHYRTPNGLRLMKTKSGKYVWNVKYLEKGDCFRVAGGTLRVHSVLSKRQIAVIWEEKIEILGLGHLKEAWAKLHNGDPDQHHFLD